MDIDKPRVAEPLLQPRSRPRFVAFLLEPAVDFLVVLLQGGAFDAVVLRSGVAVPVLESDPAAGFGVTVDENDEFA